MELPDRRTKDGLRDYALLVLLANTPLRKSEICSLAVGGLKERGGQHWIEYRVRKKRRSGAVVGVIPIRPEVAEALRKYQRSEFGRGSGRADNPMLMTLGKHGPAEKRGITAKAVDLAVAKYAGRAGIAKRITPHSFRASYATNALTAGADLKTVSLLLGHASTASTEPYLRSNMERMRRAVEGVAYV